MSSLDLVSVIVSDYDEAIEFFVGILDFDLVEDEPSLTNDGKPKRSWPRVGPDEGAQDTKPTESRSAPSVTVSEVAED